jgi:hypothetical protein
MLYFHRTPTPAEQAEIDEREARERAEWLADAPNREARHRAAIAEKRRQGAAKAAATRVRKAEREAQRVAALAVVEKRWPGVSFTAYGECALAWGDGPFESDVRASGAVPDDWYLVRRESFAARREQTPRDRLARKQARRTAKAERVRKAIARYPLALADAACRRNQLSAQLALPIDPPRRHIA